MWGRTEGWELGRIGGRRGGLGLGVVDKDVKEEL